MRMRKSAFTLVELMVVITCAMLLLIPAWQIFRQGTKQSMQGNLQIQTTQEARIVLQQVSYDLKNSCWLWDDDNIGYYTINQILKTSGAAFPSCQYSFFGFPFPGAIDDVIPKNTEADPTSRKLLRRVSHITYRLEKSPKIAKEGYPPNFPMYSLIREEQFNPKLPEAQKFKDKGYIKSSHLSDRVMMFDITPYTLSDALGTQQQFFWITLQLIDTVDRGATFVLPPPGKKLAERSKDLIIADFFEVVYPEFLASYRQMAGPRLGMSSDYSSSSYNDPIDPSLQP